MVNSLSAPRTYLFRGKRKDNGEWVYGSLIEDDEYCCILDPSKKGNWRFNYPCLDSKSGVIDGRAIPVDPETVSRYIGGDDINDAKIFEGDIVRTYFRGGIGFENAIVVDIGCLIDCGDGRCWYPQDTIDVEVIGNIWDNFDMIPERSQRWVNSSFRRERVIDERI